MTTEWFVLPSQSGVCCHPRVPDCPCCVSLLRSGQCSSECFCLQQEVRSEMVRLSAQTRLSSTTSVQSVWDCGLRAGREGGGGGGRGGSCFGLPPSLARSPPRSLQTSRLIFHHSSLGTANQTQTEKLEIVENKIPFAVTLSAARLAPPVSYHKFQTETFQEVFINFATLLSGCLISN